ncbi:MAG TPA: FtsX-like permease family protein, partial [Acidimicrobiales bacterium]|nr:FtsX-like permease family protein [Acidimicrobiales bacterium]
MIAIAGGASLAVSVFATMSSISWSFDQYSKSLVGDAQLKVIGATARAGLDARIAPEVAAVRGVASAVPVIEAITNLASPTKRVPVVVVGIPQGGSSLLYKSPGGGVSQYGTILFSPKLAPEFNSCGATSAGSSVASSSGTDGVPSISSMSTASYIPSPLVLSRGSYAISSNGGEYILGCAKMDRSLAGIASGRIIIMPLALSQQLFGRTGRLDAIYVKATPGSSVSALSGRLSRKVGAWNAVVPSGTPPPAAEVAIKSFLPLLGLLALLAVGVSAVLVHDIIGLAFSERKRQVATIAALGAPSFLFAVTLIEPAFLGFCGGGVGVIGGAIASSTIVGTLNHFIRPIAG